jgi:hypothetical protein
LSGHPGGYLKRPGNSEALESRTQGLDVVRIRDDNQPRREFKNLLGKQVNVLTSADGHNLESVSRILDDGQTLPPNRTRGA